jgi:hypothetical protein
MNINDYFGKNKLAPSLTASVKISFIIVLASMALLSVFSASINNGLPATRTVH